MLNQQKLSDEVTDFWTSKNIETKSMDYKKTKRYPNPKVG